MLTEYEARQRHQHMARDAEAAPHVVLKCLVLLVIAAVLSLFGDDKTDSSITEARSNIVRSCE
jgi:hypothetical protein